MSVSRFCKSRSGATSIEYGLIAALMAIAVIAAISLLRGPTGNLFSSPGTLLEAKSSALSG